ncbi:hypothetical protein JNW88_22410 [Micromonospora sp. ATA32]|nr:hypothetical protein [Micromonospora sp. ATA32]
MTCTATDAAGNTGSDTAVMKVVDTTAPTTGCVPTNNPSGGNIPGSYNPDGFYQLTATDLVDTAVDVYIRDATDPAVSFGPFPAAPRSSWCRRRARSRGSRTAPATSTTR